MNFLNLFSKHRQETGIRVVPLPDPPDSEVLAAAAHLLGEFDCRECGFPPPHGTRATACRHETAADKTSDWLEDVVAALRS